jgi:hypothetical protein
MHHVIPAYPEMVEGTGQCPTAERGAEDQQIKAPMARARRDTLPGWRTDRMTRNAGFDRSSLSRCRVRLHRGIAVTHQPYHTPHSFQDRHGCGSHCLWECRDYPRRQSRR